MDIATGGSEEHPTVLPYDVAGNPGVAPATVTEPTFTGARTSAAYQGGVRDLTGERLADLGVIESACQQAQSAGHAAETDRRGHYGQPLGDFAGHTGDLMDLPPVPSAALPTADQYKTVDEPFPYTDGL